MDLQTTPWNETSLQSVLNLLSKNWVLDSQKTQEQNTIVLLKEYSNKVTPSDMLL